MSISGDVRLPAVAKAEAVLGGPRPLLASTANIVLSQPHKAEIAGLNSIFPGHEKIAGWRCTHCTYFFNGGGVTNNGTLHGHLTTGR